MIGSQYGEDTILDEIFHGRLEGFLVDVGAGDGVDNSNSYHLINRGWKGVLIEPDPYQFKALKEFANGKPGVFPVPLAISTHEDYAEFWVGGQVSTMDPIWRDRCIEAHGIKYEALRVRPDRLDKVLRDCQVPDKIDLLSVDCEGRDFDVLQTMDWQRYEVGVVIVEDGGWAVDSFLKFRGFELFWRTLGNFIYRRKA